MADTNEPEAMDTKEAKAAKSTVRKRKQNAKAATQRFLPIAEIRNDTVVLKNGGLRAVLQVQALNFNLKSETEQQGIIAGYESFINTITFPVQIVLRSTKINIDPYITNLRAMAESHSNELLREQTQAYADFVEKIVDIADIMQKRFFVVVPFDDLPQKKSSFSFGKLFSFLGIDDSAAQAAQRNRRFLQSSSQLRERVNLVETGLHNVGLVTHRLNTHELVELYYSIFNPKTSQEQKLPGDRDMNVSKMVI